MKLRVVIHPSEEGGFWVEIPALPGCFTQGETMEEVIANVREAVACYLDVPEAAIPENASVREVEV